MKIEKEKNNSSTTKVHAEAVLNGDLYYGDLLLSSDTAVPLHRMLHKKSESLLEKKIHDIHVIHAFCVTQNIISRLIL